MNHAGTILAAFSIFLFLISSRSSSKASETIPGGGRPSNTAANVKTRVKTTTHLRELPDGYFAIPWLTRKNVDESVAEINARKIKRLQLGPIDETEHQSDVLRRIYQGCPHLSSLRINDWTVTQEHFKELLESLIEVTELQLNVCRFSKVPTNAKSGFESIAAKPMLIRLSVNSCRNFSNDMVSDLLAALPNLEKLSLSDSHWTGTPFDGKDWPLAKLSRLREFEISANVNDKFIRRLIDEVPGMTSLKLRECRNVTGADWVGQESIGIEELEYSRCEQLSDQAVSAFLKRTPRLKSLRISNCPGVRIGGLDLGQLKDLSQLSLRVFRQQRFEIGEMNLANLSKLRDLEIRGLQLNGDPIVQALRSLKGLESLTMYSVFPVDEPGFSFSNQTELKHLWINGCAVQPDVLATLSDSLQSVHFQRCEVTNSSVAKMLQRLSSLKSLNLASIEFGHRNGGQQKAITGSGWNFGLQKQLVHLELSNCPNITDDLIARIVKQVPALESLKLANNSKLAGKEWDLERLTKLTQLELIDLGGLMDQVMGNLPRSLESIRVVNCPQWMGQEWDLALLPRLTQLDVSRCVALTSIGKRLPISIEELRVFECFQLNCRHLDYSGLENLERISFKDCRKFDVDRLFAGLSKQAMSLRRIDLSGCPNLTSSDWDLSPQKNTLQQLIYREGETSYVGGIDEANASRLQQQLPNTRIVR